MTNNRIDSLPGTRSTVASALHWPQGMNLVICASLLVTGCGQREKAPPPVREAPHDASVVVPMADAFIDRGLGKYASIKARFEADCPRDLRRAIGEVPSLHISDANRNCRQKVAEPGRKDVARYVELIYPPDGITSYDYIDAPISRVTVGYFAGDGKPMPRSCGRAISEVVGYLRDLTGASEQQGLRVAELMRVHTKDVPRIRLMDREICLWMGNSDDGNECYADVTICDLAPQAEIVDVDLDTVAVPSPAIPAPADPAP